jgi:transposase InsO family protein
MGINAVCRLLGISKKSYYRSRSPDQRVHERYGSLRAKIGAIVKENPGYGYRRIRVALAEGHGLRVNHKLLKKLLSLWGLQLQRRIRRPARSVVRRVLDWLGGRANLLSRLQPSRCLQVLASDITEILYRGGKAYLAVHLDVQGKLIWGWSLATSPGISLVVECFRRAAKAIRDVGGELRGLIVHQDRGSVYTADAYVRCLLNEGCLVSYSRRGEPGDNAVNEAFFSRFKVEWADALSEAGNFQELLQMVARSIDYYNNKRHHSTLGYRTPLAFTNDFLASHNKPIRVVS